MSNFHTYGQEKMKSQFALGHQENYSFRISFKNVDEGMKNHMKMRIIQAKIIGIDILTISSLVVMLQAQVKTNLFYAFMIDSGRWSLI